MFVRGLKTKIAVNIAILLFLAMLMIDLVTMVTAKRDLMRSEVSRATILLAFLQHILVNGAAESDSLSAMDPKGIITELIDDSEVTCALILMEHKDAVYLGNQTEFSFNQLVSFTKEAMRAGKSMVQYSGNTWEVFWNQNTKLWMSAPVIKKGTPIGGIGIILPLKRVYSALKNSQQIVLIYSIVNLVILTFIGIYRISKLYLQPLSRLAKRADEYKEDDDLIFSVRREDNELNRLSKALNRLLKRISEDKQTLRSTVQSLEKANLELKKAQKEIIRAEKLASVGRLSAGLAHEIGNPIGIIIGYLELLKQGDITADERNEFLKRTESEIDRINTIIRQLLEVSRPSNSGRKPVSVHEIINDTAEVLRVQPLISNINVSLSLGAHDDTVYADPHQLRQVFLNLIINAADAVSFEGHTNGGQLNITTETENNIGYELKDASAVLKIIFRDNGAGIPQENIENVFDPFFTTKEPGKGTGLGLSVSFMIVASMGGRMSVASEVGKGTTMIIYLPLHQAKHFHRVMEKGNES